MTLDHKDSQNNVASVVESALCSGCGACSEICSFSALKMVRNCGGFLVPQIDMERCTSCGRCLTVCSGNPENSNRICGQNWARGDYINVYLAYAMDQKDRDMGQSGGVITALLKYLISDRLVDGAVVTGFDEEKQDSYARFVDSADDIRRYSGSVYTQSDVAGCALRNKDKKQAVVACGCHSQSLMLSGYKPDYIIGLVCERAYSLRFVNEFGKGSKKEIKFRDSSGNNWPGDVKTVFTDGTVKRFPKEKRVSLCDYYASYRCLQCFDMNNAYADLVCGDPWCMVGKMDLASLRKGYTVIASRNEKGENLIQNAQKAGYISLHAINPEDFFDENCLKYNKVGKVMATHQVLSDAKLPYLYKDTDFGKKLDDVYKVSYPKYADSGHILERLNYSYLISAATTEDQFSNYVRKEKQRLLFSRYIYLAKIKTFRFAKACKDHIIKKS